MPLGSLRAGGAVSARFTKWGGGRHWEWEGVYVGADEWGHWFFTPVGTRFARPGMEAVASNPWVSVVPHDAPWAASFYPRAQEVSIYVDATTVGRWSQVGPERWEVTMVDLDLDVVLTQDGDLFVDDEDEFLEHRVLLGYPEDVVRLAEQSARSVRAAIAAGDEPFGTVGHALLERIIRDGGVGPAS